MANRKNLHDENLGNPSPFITKQDLKQTLDEMLTSEKFKKAVVGIIQNEQIKQLYFVTKPNFKASSVSGVSGVKRPISSNNDMISVDNATRIQVNKKMFISPWNESLSNIFGKCIVKGILSSVRPYKPPAPGDEHNYCTYHVSNTHKTDECEGLMIAIQKLIEQRKMVEPIRASPNPENIPFPPFKKRGKASQSSTLAQDMFPEIA